MTASPTSTEDVAAAARALVATHLCAHEGEAVAITADRATDPVLVEALFAAARDAGARACVVTVERLPFQGALADPHVPEPLAAAVRACDLWLDLTFPYLAGSAVHAGVMEAGRARYLLAGDMGAGGLGRLYGGHDLDRLFDAQLALDALLAEAAGESCRVTSAAGTDVSFVLEPPATRKLRRADRPGTQTVPGSAVLYPKLESVRGTIVIEAVFHEWYTALADPIRIAVDGRIRAVEGTGDDVAVLERALRRAGGGDYGYVIHFSHGFHPAARFAGASFIEDIRVPGSDAIGFGLPWWQPGGGENHPDGVVRGQTLAVGGREIVRDGRVVGPDDLVGRFEACGLVAAA